MIYFLLLHLAIFFYLLIRLVLPSGFSWKVKLGLSLSLLVTSQHYLVRFAFNSLSTPEIPGFLIAFEGWCFATVIFLFVLVLVRDFFLLLKRFLLGKRSGSRPRFLSKKRRSAEYASGRRKAMLALAAMAAAPAAYGVREGTRLPRVREWSGSFPNLPKGLDGLTIAHITDLHISRLFGPDWLAELVAKINSLQPDLVLFTGDMADGSTGLRGNDVEALGLLRARLGIFGCVGNHEYYSGHRFWMARLEGLGMTMLENSHQAMGVNGAGLVIAGVTDPVARDFGLPLPDSDAALRGAPESAFKILLDHRPSAFKRNAASGANLQLSGHTHGGHIVGMDRLVARFNNGYVYGWYGAGDSRMYVSSGAGLWNGFPVRLGVESEIAHITLRSV